MLTVKETFLDANVPTQKNCHIYSQLSGFNNIILAIKILCSAYPYTCHNVIAQ